MSDSVPEEWPPLENYIKMFEIMGILNADKIDNFINKTIRAESEHQFFKRIAQSTRTYKNLSLTHKLYQAALTKDILENPIREGPATIVPVNLLSSKTLFPGVRYSRTTKWVQIMAHSTLFQNHTW